jgi:hypothetical protein
MKVYVTNVTTTGADKVFATEKQARDYLNKMPEEQRVWWRIKERDVIGTLKKEVKRAEPINDSENAKDWVNRV